jgi:two-component system, LytTR family, response regulator
MIKVLLVDDEALARKGMRSLLASIADIEIVGECEDGQAALLSIEQLQPELVFVDIQMPQLNGMSFVEQLGKRPLPLVVFVTAHDVFAVEAFDTRAVDYLLKPVRPARLLRALERVREQLHKLQAEARSKELPSDSEKSDADKSDSNKTAPRKKLLAKTKDKITPISLEEITSIEAAGNYAVVHTAGERFILRETLTTLEKELPKQEFARVNRSLILNLNQIAELQVLGAGGNQILLKDGRIVVLTLQLREMEKLLQYASR